MAQLIMVEAINLALKQEMKRDPRVMLLGEDVGLNGGVFRVSDNLMKEFGEDRVVDTPISESGIVGAAIGLAINNMRPVVEIQFAGFIYPAFDQLISHASRMRTRSRNRFTCPLVLRSPSCGGIHALEHHSESMESIYIHTPGLKVVMPSRPYNAKGLLISAIRDPDPVLFLEPTRVYRSIKEEVPEEEYVLPLGKAEIVQEGKDVTLITWGAMRFVCEQTLEKLYAEGDETEIELIDLLTLSPMDTETILNSVKKTGRCVIVQEAPRTLGLASELSAQITENLLLDLKAPVERVTAFDVIPPLLQSEDLYLPNETRVAEAIKKVLAF